MTTTARETHIRVTPLEGQAIDSLLALFADIARQEGWQPEGQLAAYRERSVYWGVSVGEALAGGLQMVLPDAEEAFPFHTVWPEAVVTTPHRTVHARILAVRPQYRGPLRLFWPLCAQMWRDCVLKDVQHIVIEATPAMRERYARIGFDLEVIGDLREHWGEPCFLCQADVHFVAGTMLTRALRSPLYRALVTRALSAAGEADCPRSNALP